jgi:subtilisin family serine protease
MFTKYGIMAAFFAALLILAPTQAGVLAQEAPAAMDDKARTKIVSEYYEKLSKLKDQEAKTGQKAEDQNLLILINDISDATDTDAKKNKLVKDLKEKHKAKEITKLESLSFVIATVPVDEVFKIALAVEVRTIFDGSVELEITGIDVSLNRTEIIQKGIANLQKSTAISTDTDVARQIVRANSVTQTGSGIKIAIIDSGISTCGTTCHTDFSGRVTNVVDYTASTFSDEQGHGTALATLAAASGSVSSGLYKGVAPAATLLNIKAWRTSAPAASTVVNGMDAAINNGAHVIVLAYQGSCFPSASYYSIAVAADQAVEKGVTVVAGAGNSPGVIAPGCSPNAITVGGIVDNNNPDINAATIWSSSAAGPTWDGLVKPDVMASAVGLHVLKKDAIPTDPLANQYYDTVGGTSYSAAIGGGVAALLIQKNPTWTPAQIKAALKQTADVANLGSDENHRGKGILDAQGAINLAASSIDYSLAYAFTVPSYPSTSSYVISSYPTTSGNSGVDYRLAKESSGLSAVNVKATNDFGTFPLTMVAQRISFPENKVGTTTYTLTDSMLFSGPRVERGSGYAHTYVMYKLSSTDKIKLSWLLAGTYLVSFATFTSTSSKTFQSTQYMNFDIASTTSNDKATPAVSPYTPYNFEQKFTTGTNFHIKDNTGGIPWLKLWYQGGTTPTEWILKWKSTESPVADPDLQYSSTESINGSGSGDNILVYYRASKTGTTAGIGPTINPYYTTPP